MFIPFPQAIDIWDKKTYENDIDNQRIFQSRSRNNIKNQKTTIRVL